MFFGHFLHHCYSSWSPDPDPDPDPLHPHLLHSHPFHPHQRGCNEVQDLADLIRALAFLFSSPVRPISRKKGVDHLYSLINHPRIFLFHSACSTPLQLATVACDSYNITNATLSSLYNSQQTNATNKQPDKRNNSM